MCFFWLLCRFFISFHAVIPSARFRPPSVQRWPFPPTPLRLFSATETCNDKQSWTTYFYYVFHKAAVFAGNLMPSAMPSRGIPIYIAHYSNFDDISPACLCLDAFVRFLLLFFCLFFVLFVFIYINCGIECLRGPLLKATIEMMIIINVNFL